MTVSMLVAAPRYQSLTVNVNAPGPQTSTVDDASRPEQRTARTLPTRRSHIATVFALACPITAGRGSRPGKPRLKPVRNGPTGVKLQHGQKQMQRTSYNLSPSHREGKT